MIFADSNLQSFHALYSNCCQFAELCFVCLLYIMGVLQRDPIPKLGFAMVLTICKDFFADCKDFLS